MSNNKETKLTRVSWTVVKMIQAEQARALNDGNRLSEAEALEILVGKAAAKKGKKQ